MNRLAHVKYVNLTSSTDLTLVHQLIRDDSYTAERKPDELFRNALSWTSEDDMTDLTFILASVLL